MKTVAHFPARVGLFAMMAAVMNACMDAPGVPCGHGYCPPDYTCEQNQCLGCGNLLLQPELGERCDDGNRIGEDGCSSDCTSDETCGNSITDMDLEACDDGNLTSGDGCSEYCTNETCGNSVVDEALGEMCDDGNFISGDGCSADCASNERCGNSVVDEALGEICDDGNDNARDECPASCKYDCENRDEIGYLVCYDRLTWEEARHVCQRYGRDLVIIDDMSENLAVSALLSKDFWIGLSDMTQEGTFRWVDDNRAPSYQPWASGEPNNNFGDGISENCTQVSERMDGQWKDWPCDMPLPFICESSGCTDC